MGDIVPNQLFVAGYSRSKVSGDKDVKDIFKKYGTIKEVAYKGSYSFVTFSSEQEALDALKATNGQTYNGQKLKVDVVDNRKGRKSGPNDEDKCFKCSKGGHWARQLVQMEDHQEEVEEDPIHVQRGVIEDLIPDHTRHTHHLDLEEEDIKTEERDTAEVQEEMEDKKSEVLVLDDHPQIQDHPKDKIQYLDKKWENQFITKRIYKLFEYISFNSFSQIIKIMKKRTLSTQLGGKKSQNIIKLQKLYNI
ncbi:unnamed protein product (macronuclear) [Paramecium tetraurelia]|uniref:RRM domain-containing protein n=1 Tax=Paramecium tetraurelia TaxID=5888 RepID=A0BCZ9_PARTE|nr:uncharacterized protein GSPATT00004510001 [Paramecium tetraurelia]CAK56416.1 unnamed protein product [Paramecium tetraurelia]|eukprot:XP_001423814.1 hypothetical protein (macronuclear) [Paramecium tetraurelia strain d4-2]